MLFNSYRFLLEFFPVVFCGFYLLGSYRPKWAAIWLALASLFFYGYWRIQALPLLVFSIFGNYGFGLLISPHDGARQQPRRAWLTGAIAANLALLAYFKYANFFIDSMNAGLQQFKLATLPALNVILPIGISFFTFTQIAFLVDCYEGKVRERSFEHYLLFVSYFPHLISGPLLHHRQIMPQFRRAKTYRLDIERVYLGLFSVAVGLAKKVLLADELAQYATPVFNVARDGVHVGFIAAWTGALAYALQIYFDFSGYTDMALGLSRMLGIEMPLNFDSPYKAASIIEFWRRWHITLSQFLRDYLYIRLGGNRLGPRRRYINLMVTMLLGGLWHGASWTFVAWGGLHGLYLLVNHAWRATTRHFSPTGAMATLIHVLSVALTFLCVLIAWVFFRSSTFPGALRVLQGMLTPSMQQFHESFQEAYRSLAVPPTSFGYLAALILSCLALVWFAPNTQQLIGYQTSLSPPRRPALAGMMLFCIALLAVINASRGISEFIYFNF